MDVLVEEGKTVPGQVLPLIEPCRWLLSLDYDGTLRQSGACPIAPEFFDMVLQWRSCGVRWGINTGRSLPYLMEDYLSCSPFLPDFVCTCERHVYLADASGRLAPETEHNRMCEQANAALRKAFLPELRQAGASIRRNHPELLWEYAVSDPLSVEAADADTMEQLAPLLHPLLKRRPGVAIQRAGRYLRFSDARYSKGTALAYVVQVWQVPETHLAMVGDGHNDLDAFRAFPRAFCAAPVTAHPDVIAYLRLHGGYVAQSPGILPILERWFSTIACSHSLKTATELR